MSKRAEERALEAYPNILFPFTPLDLNAYRREAFINGYHQAEKDILKDARWIEICEDTTWKMVEDFIHLNMDGAYRVIIVKEDEK